MPQVHGFWNKTKNVTNHMIKGAKKAGSEVWAETKSAAENVKHKLHRNGEKEALYDDYEFYEEIYDDDDIHALNEYRKHKSH